MQKLTSTFNPATPPPTRPMRLTRNALAWDETSYPNEVENLTGIALVRAALRLDGHSTIRVGNTGLVFVGDEGEPVVVDEQQGHTSMSVEKFSSMFASCMVEEGAARLENCVEGFRATMDGISSTGATQGEAVLRVHISSELIRQAQQAATPPASALEAAKRDLVEVFKSADSIGVDHLNAIVKVLGYAGELPESLAKLRSAISSQLGGGASATA